MDKWMLLAVQEEAHQEEDRKKAQAISLIARVKPFFVEFTFVGDWRNTRGVVNGAHIESVQAKHPRKPQNGTLINYVFGGKQLVTEPLDEVVTRLRQAVAEVSY